jgi:hypothetical protein
MVVYIPQTPERPIMFCLPILPFCLPPGGEQAPSTQPPIWSLLVYMLLVETGEVRDKTLRERLGVVVPSENSSSSILGSKINTRGCRYSGRQGMVEERDKSRSSSGTLTEV